MFGANPGVQLFCRNVYFSVSTGCGTADEHTKHSAVAEWDAALRSVHRAFC